MARFEVSDRVLAVVSNGEEFDIVEGFITGVEQDGRIVAVRPAASDEWEDGEMRDDPTALSWWWDADRVYHVVDAEEVVRLHSWMSEEAKHIGGECDELGVDL